jgi:hypothetical protein
MDRKPLLGGPLGYAMSASETFRTVSERKFSETRIQLCRSRGAGFCRMEFPAVEPPSAAGSRSSPRT